MLVVTYWSDTLGWRSDIPSNSSPLVDFCSFLTLCSFSSSWCFFPDCRGKTAVPTLRHTGVDFWLWNYGDRSRTWSEERHVMWRHAGFCLFVCLFVTFGEELHFSSTCRFASSVLTFCTNRRLGEKRFVLLMNRVENESKQCATAKTTKIQIKKKLNASKLQRQESSCTSPRCSFGVKTRSRKHFTPDLDQKKPRGGIYIRMSPPEEFVCNCEITEWLKWRGKTSIITLISIKQCSST